MTLKLLTPELAMKNYKLNRPYKLIQYVPQFYEKDDCVDFYASCEHYHEHEDLVVDVYFYKQKCDVLGTNWFYRMRYADDPASHSSGFVHSMARNGTFMSWFVDHMTRKAVRELSK